MGTAGSAAASEGVQIGLGSRLAEVACMTDSLGVLSAHATFVQGGQHRAEARAHRDLETLLGAGGQDGITGALRAALTSAASALRAALARPTDRGERARAVFIALHDGEERSLPLAVPIRPLLAVAPGPILWPLLAPAQSSTLIAQLTVSEHGITIRELFGLTPIAEWTLPLPEAPPARRLEGPTRSHRQSGRRAEVHRDLVDRRRSSHARAALEQAVDRLPELARRHSWSAVAVSGEPDMTERLSDALRRAGAPGPLVVHAARDGANASAHAVASLRDAEAAADAERLMAAAESGRAALGLSAVSDALREGRAERVLVAAADPETDDSGGTSPVPARFERDEDPREAVVRQALARGVPVVSLPEPAAALLPPPYVGALLARD